MADKLLQCPFCGGEARILTDMQDTTTPVFSVVCDECESITYFGDVLDKEGTVEAWNNRPSPWHTGTPTEEGVYVIKISNRPYFPYTLATWVNNEWLTKEIQIPIEDYVAWQKIEPFKED